MTQNNNSQYNKIEKPADSLAWDPNEAMKELDAEQKEHEDIKEGREGTGEIIETIEGGEISEGIEDQEVVESHERKAEDKATSFTGGKSAQTQTAQQIRDNLIKRAPSPAIMKKQIEDKIYKEIKDIHKKIRKIRKRRDMAYELNSLVAKLRELRDLLSKLAHATMDTIRNLWLRIVHGLA